MRFDWLRPIADADGYWVTTGGDVLSKGLRPLQKLKPAKDRCGYLRVDIYRSKNRTRKVHRLVLEAFVGPCPEGWLCRHLNGVRDDNRLSNLRWGTVAENRRDMERHGTVPRGEKNPIAKLTSANVRKIRRLLSEGRSSPSIAADFGVSSSCVDEAGNGRSWGWLK